MQKKQEKTGRSSKKRLHLPVFDSNKSQNDLFAMMFVRNRKLLATLCTT